LVASTLRKLRHEPKLELLQKLALRTHRAATPRTARCRRGLNWENRPRADSGKVRYAAMRVRQEAFLNIVKARFEYSELTASPWVDADGHGS